MSFLSTLNSSHAPRPGIILASTTSFSGWRLVGSDPEVHAGRADELRHDDALGVDDEGAAVGHHREVLDEDLSAP